MEGQLAVTVQTPEPLAIVTVAVAGEVPVTAPTVQIPPVPVIAGATAALVDAVTVNALLYAAEAGAPVNATVGVACTAVVEAVAVPAAYAAVAAHEAVRPHVPVPVRIVTVAVALAGVPATAPTEQTPGVPPIAGMTPEFVVAVTWTRVL